MSEPREVAVEDVEPGDVIRATVKQGPFLFRRLCVVETVRESRWSSGALDVRGRIWTLAGKWTVRRHSLMKPWTVTAPEAAPLPPAPSPSERDNG